MGQSNTASFTLLRMGKVGLLLPQSDIRVLELSLDIDPSEPPPNGVGWISYGLGRCPAYCCTDQLIWQTSICPERSLCAVLTVDGQDFAFLCVDATLVDSANIHFYDIPHAMRTPHQPFSGIATCPEGIVCVTSARQLLTDILRGASHLVKANDCERV